MPWADGVVSTPIGAVPRVRTVLGFSDKLGAWRARWGIWRMRYMVPPGLYAAGNPVAESPVLVTANYKLSFDRLRSELGALDAWIMVIDTRGINVWCAAGKGTFGTEEIVNKISSFGLEKIVSHKRLIVPQLGAPGVSAHDVKRASGFRVTYGPVRAKDIESFIADGYKASPGMRKVEFPLIDRVVLVPMELIPGLKVASAVAAAIFVLSGLSASGFSVDTMLSAGIVNAAIFSYGFLGAVVLGPALLPWLPGRAFSLKGFWLGLSLAAAFAIYASVMRPGLLPGGLMGAGLALIIATVSSYLVMNFTGSTTFTHLSGVKGEMRIAVPLQIAGALIGSGLWIGGLFV